MCNLKKSIIELVRLLGNIYDVERNYLDGKITGVKKLLAQDFEGNIFAKRLNVHFMQHL